MTTKRFEYNVNKNSIEYNRKHFAYCNVEQNKIANKLNELHEENDALKQELKTKAIVNKQYEELQRVKKENEQLKSSDTITDLETEIMKLKTTIQQLRTDNTKQKKQLNTAMKENEQLKKEIENLKQGMIHAAFDKEWK